MALRQDKTENIQSISTTESKEAKDLEKQRRQLAKHLGFLVAVYHRQKQEAIAGLNSAAKRGR
ncbi:hypothetical protein [Rubinisphaera margarita]|uniref:hypothetical protein n=1 Tax=Rubinisphaera margarita TaxID=2909586 RepID=UPI001EE847F7|nr:hypothetical protein [Rubinisphaera margarita]MCG6157269.1 hypothetical protein [Rubinisphaera margarita]